MPTNFQPHFYNGAHPDLQLEGRLMGYESVELKNLNPEGLVRFYLSGLEPVVIVSKFERKHQFLIDAIRGDTIEEDENEVQARELPELSQLPKSDEYVKLNLDTICIIPDKNQLYQVWRGLCPVRDLDLIAAEIASIKIGIRKIEHRPEERAIPRKRRLPRTPVEIGLLESTQSFSVQSEHQEAKSPNFHDSEPIDFTGDLSVAETPLDNDENYDEQQAVEMLDSKKRTDGEISVDDPEIIDIGLIESTQEFSVVDVEEPERIEAYEEKAQAVPEKRSSGEWASDIHNAVDIQGVDVESKKNEAHRGEIIKNEPSALLSHDQSASQQEPPGIIEPDDAVEATQPINPDDEKIASEALLEPMPQALPYSKPVPKTKKPSLEKIIRSLASLYLKRLSILTSPVDKWEALSNIEKQLLKLGKANRKIGKKGLHKLIKMLENSDQSIVFAAAFSLLMLSPSQSFKVLLRATAAAPLERIRSLVDAVRFANIESDELSQLMTDHIRIADPSVKMFLIEIIGDRRISNERINGFIGKCLLGTNRDVMVAALKAQGKLRLPEFLTLIRRLALSPDPIIQDAALLDLLLDGKYEAFRVLRRLCNQTTKSGSQRYTYLSFNGGKPDVPLLMKHTNEPFALWGIGFLGYADAVPILIKLLNSNFNAICLASSEALQIITGAVFENQGEHDSRKRFVSRCASHEQWEQWWKSFGAKFSKDVRWRKGKAFNPGRCIQQMSDSSLSFLERQWAYYELLIRTGENIPFEADWLVHEQRAALLQWEQWWKTRGKVLND